MHRVYKSIIYEWMWMWMWCWAGRSESVSWASVCGLWRCASLWERSVFGVTCATRLQSRWRALVRLVTQQTVGSALCSPSIEYQPPAAPLLSAACCPPLHSPLFLLLSSQPLAHTFAHMILSAYPSGSTEFHSSPSPFGSTGSYRSYGSCGSFAGSVGLFLVSTPHSPYLLWFLLIFAHLAIFFIYIFQISCIILNWLNFPITTHSDLSSRNFTVLCRQNQ